jgi:hypothetical protein
MRVAKLSQGMLAFAAACATAGTSARDQPGDAPARSVDSATRPFDAARPPNDASLPDAFVVHDALLPDASNPLVCSVNSDCVVPGTCCFVALCVAGTAVGNTLCFPS